MATAFDAAVLRVRWTDERDEAGLIRRLADRGHVVTWAGRVEQVLIGRARDPIDDLLIVGTYAADDLCRYDTVATWQVDKCVQWPPDARRGIQAWFRQHHEPGVPTAASWARQRDYTALAARFSRKGLGPTAERLREFALAESAARPVLCTFQTFQTLDDGDASGRKALARFDEALGPTVARLGAEPRWMAHGSDSGWDDIALTEYPSRAAFVDVLASDAFGDASGDRDAGLAAVELLVCSSWTGFAQTRTETTVCPAPWMQQYVKENGTYNVCCYARDADVVGDDGRRLHVLNGHTHDDVVNSKFVRDVKSQMMRGEWPKICADCESAEKLGGGYRFEKLGQCDQNELRELVARTEADGTSPPVLSQVHYSLGNTCNLRCRSCGPWSSTRWLNETHLLEGGKLSRESFSGKDYQWYRDEAAWKPLLDSLHNTQVVHFSGGEPMLIPQMLQLLQRMIAAGESHHIVLYYNTNVTNVPGEIRDLWPHFKGVTLTCSIDGFGRINDYIRNPSVWSEIDANLTHFDDQFDEYGISSIRIGCVVQVYNVLRLNELMEYVDKKNFKHVRTIIMSPLQHPDHLNVRILPRALRQLAIERLASAREQFFATDGGSDPALYTSIDSIISVLEQPDVDDAEELQGKFARTTRALDESRGENLLDLVPELTPLMRA